MMTLLMIGIGAVAIIVMTGRYWVQSNTSEMGTMSRQWLAEHNASNP